MSSWTGRSAVPTFFNLLPVNTLRIFPAHQPVLRQPDRASGTDVRTRDFRGNSMTPRPVETQSNTRHGGHRRNARTESNCSRRRHLGGKSCDLSDETRFLTLQGFHCCGKKPIGNRECVCRKMRRNRLAFRAHISVPQVCGQCERLGGNERWCPSR